MNAHSVVGIPWGGRDTEALPYAKNLFEFFALKGGRDEKTLGNSACTQAQALMLSLMSEPPSGIFTA